MCGRALEGICLHHHKKVDSLQAGLLELLNADIIDKRLYTWSEELRKLRNLGAHASDIVVPHNDAKDVLDFLHAITDYVFVLNDKFSKFMNRRRPKP